MSSHSAAGAGVNLNDNGIKWSSETMGEREQSTTESKKRELLIRKQHERERMQIEEREEQKGENWPQHQEAITGPSPRVCNHYQRHCRVRSLVAHNSIHAITATTIPEHVIMKRLRLVM